MKKNIKKSIFFAAFVFSASISVCFAASKKPAPEWFGSEENLRSVFPRSDFIAIQGEGTNDESSKNNAITQLAMYFKSEVNSTVQSTEFYSQNQNDEIIKTSQLLTEQNVSTQLELFGVRTTESYKNSKKYYCVAYINRNEAWKIYRPIIERRKNTFMEFFNKAEAEKSPLLKINLYNAAIPSGQEFLLSLLYGRMILPEKVLEFQNEEKNVTKIPALKNEALFSSTVKITLSNDFENKVNNSITDFLKSVSIPVVNNSLAEYVAAVFIEDNAKIEDEIIAIYPVVTLTLVSKDGREIYSFSKSSEKKFAAYSETKVRRDAYNEITKTLKDEIESDFRKKFGL